MTSISVQKTVKTISAQHGQHVSIAGNDYRIIISGTETDGKFAVIDRSVPPEGGPNPHAHHNLHDTLFVIEGEIEFTTESDAFIAKKGAFVNIPLGGAIHSFKKVSNAYARLVCTVMPSGLEEFFLEADALLQSQPAANPNTVEKPNDLLKKYGQTMFPPDYLD